MNTITFTPKADGSYFTVGELNALFTQIKTTLDGKLDVRGAVITHNLHLSDGSAIINVPPPLELGDPMRTNSEGNID